MVMMTKLVGSVDGDVCECLKIVNHTPLISCYQSTMTQRFDVISDDTNIRVSDKMWQQIRYKYLKFANLSFLQTEVFESVLAAAFNFEMVNGDDNNNTNNVSIHLTFPDS